MANLLIDDDTLTIELTMAEKAEALHGNLTVPRSAITESRVVPDGMAEVHGFKLAGSGIPGVIRAGSFRNSQGSTFAVCHGANPAIVLQLTGQRYDLIVVTVDNPDDVLAALR